jgi:GTP-binding protein
MKTTSAEFIKSATQPSQYPDYSYPEVAFAGKSNVGKSSLINALVNRRKLAQTSSTPGKTRLLNFFLINGRVSFVDLPGYGYARVSQDTRKEWKPMVERYLSERKELGLVILILDIRRDPSADDLSLLEWLQFYERNFLIVLTKCDKLSRGQGKARVKLITKALAVPEENTVLFSAVTGEGKAEIWKFISKIVN